MKIIRARTFTHDTGAMRFVGVDEGEQRIHPGPRPHVVKERIQFLLRERGDADGNGDHRG